MKLGKNQEAILKALHAHDVWYPGCGWIWKNPSTTESLLDSLVNRGLATKKICVNRWMTAGVEYTREYPYYRPVDDA